VTDIEAYLDLACAGLKINPAQAQDIREELRAHLEDLMQSRGVDLSDSKAVETALLEFGDPSKVAGVLGLIHRGELLWRKRLKGAIFGVFLGAILAFLAVGDNAISHPLRLLISPFGPSWEALIWFNCLAVAGLLGSLSILGKPLLFGWWFGIFCWLLEYGVLWSASIVLKRHLLSSELFSSPALFLLAPLLGGVYGLVISLGTLSLAALTARLRPDIR
jgi:hypothetical protein